MAILDRSLVFAAIAVAMLAPRPRRPHAAQQSIPSCASKLVPCANYLNSTKPPESCCGPLKDAVKNELPCLCSLFNSPDIIKAFGINMTQALELPKRCGVNSNTSLCSKSGATPPSSAKTPPGGSGGKSGSGGDSSSGKNNNSGAFVGATWIGIPSLVSLFLFAWCMMAL
ncbi:uncharacterized protein A4U43_C01F12350 [Asparagus officinalis]|uniref:Bifunctional inhibitor/plant lipid transfer protein/seed storage helical domain-containing protein n=1 Tax=Asparagus officinalis TaxID=4686 RepID=A0A5P1FRB2_ASPOF|nr:non-specific lipid-transfer protein 2-like [Asparagus officinalis]ONK79967.1 uncharacterized protein A4U43_C01F12350 [Asparagus officinalis]